MNEELKYQFSINIKDLNNAHTRCINFIDNNSTVLDVGCASGVIGEYLSKEKKCTLIGIDNDDKQLFVADSKKCYKKLFNMNLNKIDNEINEYVNYFDYILLADVLEHLYDPAELLEKLKPYLKSNNSYFIMSIPNISHGVIKLKLLHNKFEYTSAGLLDDTHIRFFTLSSIIELLNNLNLQIINLERIYNNIDTTFQKIRIKDFPKTIQKYVKKDFDSHVYQYIIKVKVSDESDIQENNNGFKIITVADKKEMSKYIKKDKSFWKRMNEKFKKLCGCNTNI